LVNFLKTILAFRRFAMPRRIAMIELRDIILQLRRGCGIKHIHRTTGHHRTVIRTLKAIAEARDWLNPQKPPPEEAAVREAWVSTSDCGTKHQLDCIREDLLRWHKEGISFVVMHRLAWVFSARLGYSRKA
jgi:hypothetical protein